MTVISEPSVNSYRNQATWQRSLLTGCVVARHGQEGGPAQEGGVDQEIRITERYGQRAGHREEEAFIGRWRQAGSCPEAGG